MKNKIAKVILAGITAVNITACGSANLNAPVNGSNYFSSFNTRQPFNPEEITGKSLGKWGSLYLSAGKISGNKNGYNTEKEYVSAILSMQSSVLKNSSDYIVVEGTDGKFYLYEIKAGNNTLNDVRDLSAYKSLRETRLVTNLSVSNGKVQVVCIASEDGHMRFQNGEKSPVAYTPTATPEEALVRLKSMEKTLASAMDHKGLFPVMYRVITERAYKELLNYRREGNMKAAMFEEELLINFANKYFEAYDAYTSNRMNNLTEVWKMAFDSGRKSQNINLNKSGNIAEILALSMNAHIIHDLAFTLKEIGYDKNDPVLKETFDRFNTVLFEEKDNILKAINSYYGKNIVQSANDFFGRTGDFTMQRIFSIMRGIASNGSYKDKDTVVRTAISYADGITKIVPGGNSVRIAGSN